MGGSNSCEAEISQWKIDLAVCTSALETRDKIMKELDALAKQQAAEISALMASINVLKGQLISCQANCKDQEPALAICERDRRVCEQDLKTVSTNASFLYVYPQAYAANFAGPNPNPPSFAVDKPLQLYWTSAPVPPSLEATFNAKPNLPSGLTLDSRGNIVGTPLELRPMTTYAITLDLVGSAPNQLPIVTSYVRFAIV